MDQLKQMRSTVDALPRQAQLAVAGIVVVTLLVLIVVARAATHTEWIAVTSGMQPANSAKAMKVLEGEKIEAKLVDNATSIEVPKSVVDTARAALESNGVGTSAGSHTDCDKAFGTGSSTFSSSTSAQMNIKLKTCLQGEIANKIEGLSGTGIQAASVTLVSSGTELFSSEETSASAAITIDSGGQQISNKQVRAITALATGSVKNLKSEDVQIVDEQGTLLSDAASSGDAVTHDQLKLKVEALYNQQKEAEYTAKLEKIAGPGNVGIISAVELDMDKITREVKEFGGTDNEQGPVAAEAIKTERLDGTGTIPGGTAGTASNVNRDPDDAAQYAGTEDAEGNTNGYLNDDRKITYSNDEVAEAIQVAPGTVKRNRFAVTVDDSVSPETANAVKNHMQALMGGDPADSFNFETVAMPEPADLTEAAAIGERREALMGYIKWALLGLGLIGMAFFLRRTLNQRTYELLNPRDEMLMIESGLDPVPLKELEAAIANVNSFDNQKRIELQKKVESIAQTKPHDVAQQLRGWLHETEYTTQATRR